MNEILPENPLEPKKKVLIAFDFKFSRSGSESIGVEITTGN